MELFLQNQNIWYYTLSTSAQVLGAIFGLTAVFVVYKVQTLETIYSEIKNASRKIVTSFNSPYGDSNNLEEIMQLFDDKKLIKSFKKMLEDIKTGKTGSLLSITTEIGRLEANEQTLTVLIKSIETKKFILYKFVQISIIISFAISFCIILLAFSSPVSSLSYKLFGTCVVGALVALIVSSISIFEIIRS